MSTDSHYEYGVHMCSQLFLDEENTQPELDKTQFTLGIMSVCRNQVGPRPEPGEMIRMTDKEMISKYGDMTIFKVIECLDGSGDVWFEDSNPYYDDDGKAIQSKCSPRECAWG